MRAVPHPIRSAPARSCDFPGMRLNRCWGVDDEPKRPGASVLTGKVDDMVFSVADERFLILRERRGLQCVEQLVNALDPDIDGSHYRIAQALSRTSTTTVLPGTR